MNTIRLIFLLFLFLSIPIPQALQANSEALFRSGDIILISQRCWLCSLIELEEGAPFSHMGILLNNAKGQWTVLEASEHGVAATAYDQFIRKARPDSMILVRRVAKMNLLKRLQNTDSFWNLFRNEFEGLNYDPQFLWNNYDERNKEKLYCSEFVSKIFKKFLSFSFPTKPMHFQQNRLAWEHYFSQSTIPEGLPGNSPADFAKSTLFITVQSWSQLSAQE